MKCQHEECTKPKVAKGYCGAHYSHFVKYGTPISPFGYGERRKHPLYGAWQWQGRVKEGRVERWSDFWQFVADVKPRPSPRHWARRYDEKAPYGPENFYWQELQEPTPDRTARCNRALGFFRDSTDMLQKAVAYLKQHQQ